MRHPRRNPIVSAISLIAIAWSRESIAAPPVSTTRVEIEADELDSDLEARDLTLRGHVVLRGDRFKIRSASLRMIRRENGSIRLIGPLEIAPCACDDPPLWFTVDNAEVDTNEASVSLRGATARVGGIPLFWTPWLSLRGPSSVGLLAPRFAWRGRDGFLFGAGAHVPLWASAWVESSPAFYVAGGHEIVSSLHSERSESSVRWDHREGRDLVDITSRGVLPTRDGTAAWTIDAIRGSRARVASLSLDSASRSFDRAEATWTTGRDGWLFSSGVVAGAVRGVGTVAIGPRIAVNRSISVGAIEGAVSASFASLQQGEYVWNLSRVNADLASSTWLGPLRVDANADAATMVAALSDASRANLSMTARTSAAIPVFKTYAPTLVHVIEPAVSVSAFAAKDASSSVRDSWFVSDPRIGLSSALASGSMLLPALSIDQRLGDPRGHGWRFVVASGTTISSDHIAPITRARTAVGTRWLSASGDVLAQRDPSSTRALAMGAIDIAPQARVSVGVDSSWRNGVDPVVTRWLLPSVVSPIGSTGWINSDGISAGLNSRIRLRERLTLSGRLDRDLSAGTWLGQRAELRYGDACGCLAISAIAAHRLGREGIDVMVGVDIAPR